MKKSFSETVYARAARIPEGKVMTYGQLARLAGKSRAARAVGALMKANTNPAKIPCHRVVAADGSLRGYAFGNGVSTKKKLLKKEGVHFLPSGKVDLKHSQSAS